MTIRTSNSKNHAARNKGERIMNNATKAKLRANFDFIRSEYERDPDDPINVENTHHAMHEKWLAFLDAGCEVNLVVSMMRPLDVWMNRKELMSRGVAEINPARLFPNYLDDSLFPEDLSPKNPNNIARLFSDCSRRVFSEEFILTHWDELAKCGVAPDMLAEQCCGILDIQIVSDLEGLQARGVSIQKAFDLVKGSLDPTDRPWDCVENLTWLYDHGLPGDDIKAWIEEHETRSMNDFVVSSSGIGFYEKLGIDCDYVVEDWLNRKGHQFFYREYEPTQLPKGISLEKLVDYFNMEEILGYCPHRKFGSFIADYDENGGSVDKLAEKFMNDIASSDYALYSEAMSVLVDAGASASIIDPAKYNLI